MAGVSRNLLTAKNCHLSFKHHNQHHCTFLPCKCEHVSLDLHNVKRIRKAKHCGHSHFVLALVQPSFHFSNPLGMRKVCNKVISFHSYSLNNNCDHYFLSWGGGGVVTQKLETVAAGQGKRH